MFALCNRLRCTHLALIVLLCAMLVPPAETTLAVASSRRAAQTTSAALPALSLDRCTDWSEARMRDVIGEDDALVSDYIAYNYAFGEAYPIPGVPKADGNWHVLTRPDVPFAVFYTEDGHPGDEISDTGSGSVTAFGNFDEDGDLVPDYAERVIHCLDVAHKRYKTHYTVDSSFDLGLRYTIVETPSSGGGRQVGKFYPVVIRHVPQMGYVAPNFPPGASQNSTLMTIDQDVFARNVAEVHPWLYPDLENTIYHELAHVYQGMFTTHPENLFSLPKWWVLEGTAVYAADQALLPQCSADAANPPRIGGLAFPGDCLKPNRHQRDSEQELRSLFETPWLGLARDNGFHASNTNRYTSVLFWYYVQARLQEEAGASDVLRTFWRDHHGLPSALRRWAQAETPYGGLEALYHQYMIDNYLQQIAITGAKAVYDNPYYDSWSTWVGAAPGDPWYAVPSLPVSEMTIRSANSAIVPFNSTSPTILEGDVGSVDDFAVEYLGTRYFVFEPASTAPTTATLTVNLRLDSKTPTGTYQVTVLNLDNTVTDTIPSEKIISLNETQGNVFRIPNFGGSQRKAVFVVSKVGAYGHQDSTSPEYDQLPFTLEAYLSDDPMVLTAEPSSFSPNDDGEKDTVTFHYFLPPLNSSSGHTKYDVQLDLIFPNGGEQPAAFVPDQQMGQAHSYTWDGVLPLISDVPLDGTYTVRLTATEQGDGSSGGSTRIFTTTIDIDTQAPPTVTNLQFVVGSVGSPDEPAESDVLSWDAIIDNSPGGFSYEIFRSMRPITDTTKSGIVVDSTRTSRTFRHVSSPQYFVVVTRDAAGNKSVSDPLETAVGLSDIVLIIDDSESMKEAPTNYLSTGVTGTLELLNLLHDRDRVAITSMQDGDDDEPTLSWTTLDTSGRTAATDLLTDYLDSSATGSPMNRAFSWALDQFAMTPVAGSNRTQAIVIFTDGKWNVDDSTVAALAAADVSLFFVLVPEHSTTKVDELITATAGAEPESAMFARSDIVLSFHEVAQALRNVDGVSESGSLDPGGYKEVSIQVDSSVTSASASVTWGAPGDAPMLTLLSPEGDRYELDDLPLGVNVAQSADAATFSFEPGMAQYGIWTVRLEHPDQTMGPSSGASQLITGNSGTTRLFLPLIRRGGASLQGGQPPVVTQTSSGDAISYEAETSIGSSLNTEIATTKGAALQVTLSDPTGPLTDTTTLWANITASNGVTETLVLFDDGQHADGSAQDGIYAANAKAPLLPGLLQVDLHLRHFSEARGYLQQTITRDIHRPYDPYEIDDTSAQAQLIALNEEQHHTLRNDDEQDWFSFVHEAGTPQFTALTESYEDLQLDLYAGDATTLLASSTEPSFTLSQATVGTYYLRVSRLYPGGSATNYSFMLSEKTCWPDQYETNNTAGQAQSLPVGVIQAHRVCSGDEDWIRVTPEVGMPHTVTLTNTADSYALTLDLVASDGATVLKSALGRSFSFLSEPLASDAPYFLRVYTTSGPRPRDYEVRVTPLTCPADPAEPDNFASSARPFTLGTTRPSTICFLKDPDWVSVDAVAGHTYTIATSGLRWINGSTLEVYASDGRTVLASASVNQTAQEPYLEVTPETSGMFYVKVRAGASAQPGAAYNLKITAIDNTVCTDSAEPDGNASLAKPYHLGHTQPHALCGANDEDWVSFPGSAGVTYTIETLKLKPGTDTYLELYNFGGSVLWETDDTPYNRASSLTFTASSTRTYHVRVRADSGHTDANGAYQLRIRTNQCADVYELDSSKVQARPITVGDLQTRALCGPGDVDWVSFAATAGTVYRFETINPASWRLYPKLTLYATDGTTVLVEQSDWNGKARVEFLPATSGTYYLQVQNLNSSVGTANEVYDLLVTAADPATCQDGYEPDNGSATAQSISVDESQNRVFCIPGDEDWFALTAEADTVYRVETTTIVPNNTARLVIYAPDASTVVAEHDWMGSFEFLATQAGTYYLQMRRADGGGFPGSSYSLAVTAPTCSDPSEPNNSSAEAGAIAADTTQTHAFCRAGDNDWLTLTATAGVPMLIETANLNGVDTYLELYEIDGTTLIAEDDNGNSDEWPASRLVLEPTTSGTYYIRVRETYDYGRSDATYDLRVKTFVCTDVHEPDNDSASASQLAANTTQSHAFCTSGDEDWVALTAEEGTSYTIETANLADGVDTYLEFYDTDGSTLLAEDDDGNDAEWRASRIVFEPSTSGVYYIRVQEYSGNGRPDLTYDLSVQATALP